MYSRAGNFSAQSLNARILQNTLLGTNFVLLQSPDKSITIDGKGISLIDAGNPLNLMRVMSGGIFVSSDGGKSWVTGLTAQGLSADLITAGTINTSKINLSGGEGAPAFSWDIRGINAFAYDRDDQNNIVIKQNKFIRFDQYGFYLAELGTDETSENFDIGLASTINPVKYIQDRTRLSITWDGFYMKTNEGSVIIDPEKDLQVLTDSRQQRMRIGWYPKVSSEEDDPEITDPAGGYGLAIKNEADAFIFHTGLQESTGSDPYNPAIYMPNLPTTTTATDKLLFVGSDGKIYASKFTYANIDSISTAW
jgi:hypothetical protein